MKGENFADTGETPQIAPSQVHGKNIIHVDDKNFLNYALPKRPEADGILLTTRKAEALLRFADCAPVMLWAEHWVMILHSGYKSTTLNISGEGVKLIRRVFGENGELGKNGKNSVKNLCAWIGPCIGRDNYSRNINDPWTVSGLKAFHRENYYEKDDRDEKNEKDEKDKKNGRIYFDLAGEIRAQLLDCGLDEKNIKLSGIDTFTSSDCYSYRRGDIKERMTLKVKLV